MSFEEDQRFSPILFGAIGGFVLLGAALAAWHMPAEQGIGHIPLTILPLILVAAVYFLVRLRTEVRGRSLTVRLAPFGRMTIPLKDIRSVEVIEYRPLRDFGGWGVRYGRGGKMYNARGNRAVRLEVGSQGVVYVGSARPEDLAEALKRGAAG